MPLKTDEIFKIATIGQSHCKVGVNVGFRKLHKWSDTGLPHQTLERCEEMEFPKLSNKQLGQSIKPI